MLGGGKEARKVVFSVYYLERRSDNYIASPRSRRDPRVSHNVLMDGALAAKQQ